MIYILWNKSDLELEILLNSLLNTEIKPLLAFLHLLEIISFMELER